jgi:capsid protein
MRAQDGRSAPIQKNVGRFGEVRLGLETEERLAALKGELADIFACIFADLQATGKLDIRPGTDPSTEGSGKANVQRDR